MVDFHCPWVDCRPIINIPRCTDHDSRIKHVYIICDHSAIKFYGIPKVICKNIFSLLVLNVASPSDMRVDIHGTLSHVG